jgi:hypothetical protein
VLNPPAALPLDALTDALGRGWGVRPVSLDYRPVGFGSHHWEVVDAAGRRWFATVDDLHGPGEYGRIDDALATAVALRDAGLDFVVAPLSTVDGGVLVRVGDGFAAALYPFVEGRSFGWGEFASPTHRAAVLEMVTAVHTAPVAARRRARTDDFAVPHVEALRTPVPDAGPYSVRVAGLLDRHADAVHRLLTGYADLVAAASLDRAVLTHGEPHPGNTMLTAGGWRLIDWDTVLVAPPERDLWSLDPGDGSVLAAYEAATGVRPDKDMLALYRTRWTVADVADFVAGLTRPHTGDANDAESWTNLEAIVAGLP